MISQYSKEHAAELIDTAKKIAVRGKGILAADESEGTIGKRFAAISLENTEPNRAAYRELLFTTKGIGQYISGAILYDETFYQTGPTTKKSMIQLLKEAGIIPGIKLDKGTVNLPGTDEEKATQGLDGLAERCKKYYEGGAKFAKWRAVLTIDKDKKKPSLLSIKETAHTLARYAAICQQNKLVPIVEPEILADGTHTIEDCSKITELVLSYVFHELQQHHILLEGCLLKPNMVTHGFNSGKTSSPSEVAVYTLSVLKRTVPAALPGIMFLSGGQSEIDATLNLNAMNKLEKAAPWSLSFSYGRALQATVIKTWKGKSDCVAAAQEQFIIRAKANSEAQLGTHKHDEKISDQAKQTLHEAGYVY